MKKFFLLFIFLILFGLFYTYIDFSRYFHGLIDDTGKVLVPIKYSYISPSIQLWEGKGYLNQYPHVFPPTGASNPTESYCFGTNFFSTDVYDKTGFLFHTKGRLWDMIGNVKIYMGMNPKLKNIYYKDKLIEKKVKYYSLINNFLIIKKKEGDNILDTETGKYLLPTYYDYVSYDLGFFHARKGELNELFDIKGNKLYSGKTYANNIVKDLIISDGYLYTKDGQKFNNMLLQNYTIYNDNLYIIKDYKPYIYNREKNAFERTEIDYTRLNEFSNYNINRFYVHKNDKFGIILDDFESPVIYDDIIRFSKKKKAFVVKLNNKYGVVGPNANLPCIYDFISIDENSENNYYLAYKYNNPDTNSLFPDYTLKKNKYIKSDYPKGIIIGKIIPMPPAQVTVINSSGKELIPYYDNTYNKIKICNKYILVITRKQTIIYDNKGNKITTLDKSHNEADIAYNNLLCLWWDEYIDLETQKKYSSFVDFIADKNPEIPYIKDCKIINNGSAKLIVYKKPLFKR